MKEQILTGTLPERIDQILRFVKEKNTDEAELESIERVYASADVPFTKAARAFYAEYSRPFWGTRLETVGENGKRKAVPFAYSLYGDDPEGELMDVFAERLHGIYYEENPFGDFFGVAETAKADAARNAVPLGEIGYSYPASIWITDDQHLLAFHDYDDSRMVEYESLADFLSVEMIPCVPDVVCKYSSLWGGAVLCDKLEELKIQPVGDGMIDLICPPSNITTFIDFCKRRGHKIYGFTWWCAADENHSPCGMGGPLSKYFDGWFSEIPMDGLIALKNHDEYRRFFTKEWPESVAYKACYWPAFWLEDPFKIDKNPNQEKR